MPAATRLNVIPAASPQSMDMPHGAASLSPDEHPHQSIDAVFNDFPPVFHTAGPLVITSAATTDAGSRTNEWRTIFGRTHIRNKNITNI
jgi:hypothetical protein